MPVHERTKQLTWIMQDEIIATHNTQMIQFWDVNARKITHEVPVEGAITDFKWFETTQKLYILTTTKIWLYDYPSNQLEIFIDLSHNCQQIENARLSANAMAIRNDQAQLAVLANTPCKDEFSGQYLNYVQIWNLETTNMELALGYREFIGGIQYLNDQIVISNLDTYLINIENQTLSQEFSKLGTSVFSEHNGWFASNLLSGEILIWHPN